MLRKGPGRRKPHGKEQKDLGGSLYKEDSQDPDGRVRDQEEWGLAQDRETGAGMRALTDSCKDINPWRVWTESGSTYF